MLMHPGTVHAHFKMHAGMRISSIDTCMVIGNLVQLLVFHLVNQLGPTLTPCWTCHQPMIHVDWAC